MGKQSSYSKTTFSAATSNAGALAAWTNPDNARIDDGSASATTLIGPLSHTNDLHLRILNNFGPTYPNQVLPSQAVIDGIEIIIDRSGGSAFSIKDYNIQLTKGNNGDGTPTGFISVGSNYAKTGLWPAALSTTSRVTYGGPTDLWGTTWKASEVKNSYFGVTISTQNIASSGSTTAQVQYVGVNVYWHVGKQDGVPKRYQMKIYSRANTYLGQLPQASSVFSVGQDINTGGGQITISVPLSIDTASLQSSGSLQDETGADLQDEAGNSLLTEGATPVVSVGTGTGLIRNGNRIVVYETSYWYTNGRIMFRGVIENWQAEIGNDDQIVIRAYSDGSDLDWYPLIGPPYTATLDQSQTTVPNYYAAQDNISSFYYYGQTFTVGTGVTNLGAVELYVNGTATVTFNVHSSPTTLSPVLASVRQAVDTAGAWTTVTFTLPYHIATTPGATYLFAVVPDSGQTLNIAGSTLNPYAGGGGYLMSWSGTGVKPTTYSAITGWDFYFKTYSTTGNTSASYTSLDPSTGMLASFMSDYKSRGGAVSYNSTSVDATGLTLTYNMKSNTVLEGIKAMLNLAPNGFYWYVDMADNTLYFKNSSTAADVTLTKGRHINGITLTASIENVINYYLFSGGDVTPGVNLYKQYTDTTSIALYGQRLDRRSDNRVTQDATADAIGQSAIASQKDEVFQTTVTLSDSTIDTAGLHVGLIIGFRGFGTFIDNLLMQIVTVNYTPEETTLTLGALPKRTSLHNERILRELIALQTIDNPSSPS